MKLSLPFRCSSCLMFFAIYALGSSIGSAQLTVTTTASPWPVNTPLTLSACGGPKIFHVNFYVGTSPTSVFGSPVATVLKTAGEPASYSWTPTQEGKFYLGAETPDGPQYCGSGPGPVTTQWILTAPSYFGFYNSYNDISSVTSFVNTDWISCNSPSECATYLQEAKNNNMHAVVETFSSPGLPAPGSSASTVNAWSLSFSNNWQSYASVFAQYQATIAAFFPYDEPIQGEWAAGNNASTTTSYLANAASTIKKTFPSAKVGMFFTGAETFTYLVHGQNVIPYNFDWIGIDIYSCWYTCNDASGNLPESYTWYVQNLESNLYSGQKVILLPASAYDYLGTLAQFNANPPEDAIDTQIQYSQNILDLAGTDPHVIGVFGFLYHTFTQGSTTWVGLNDSALIYMYDIFHEFGIDVEKR